MDPKDLKRAVRAAIAESVAPSADVRHALVTGVDPVVLTSIGVALRDLAPQTAGLRPVRLRVMGTASLGVLPSLLRAVLVGAGLAPVIETGEYGHFEMELAVGPLQGEPAPDAVLCLLSEDFFLPAEPQGMPCTDVIAYIEARAAEFRGLLEGAAQQVPATFILHTVPLTRAVRDSFISVRQRAAVAASWHRLNAELLAFTEEDHRFITMDLAGLLALQPIQARDNRLHKYADMPYTDAALLLIAQETRRVLQAAAGLSRKVLALDADNTLWGGVLGEVGAQGIHLGGLYPGNAYADLQQAVAALRAQGVVLVLASKNDSDSVYEVLSQHPAMRLRPEKFSVVAANWAPKADNLRGAADVLGLPTGSFLFMDDSPFERDHVRAELPGIAVLAADGDPAHLVNVLLSGGWFDILEVTGTDRARPDLYRSRALRGEYSKEFSSSEDFLRALDLRLTAAEATPFSIARIAQLSARTNQFNVTGTRFDQVDTEDMCADPNHLVAEFSVADRFGDEGLVGAAWVRRAADEWSVLNLVLSCRVLGRGVELAAAQWLIDQAAIAGASRLRAEFVPSPRNAVAADVWARAGLLRCDDDRDGVHRYVGELHELSRVMPDWITVKMERVDE